ncbi:hypothetical protein NONI108955_21285 [Nocardia ninae]|uniref:Uncharacterized protein n=1 Tax=Nocardia ninae NBRC 108245 TaxID=1210091 RepID=A0A511MA68_9NOCA|nr:hypothetical protein [Nocardia ninae]GEM37489.1 hypothetical protein NN4_20080 [Nocardia ninae NBRC 108245]
MTDIVIDLDALVQQVRAVARENPEFVYQSAGYEDDGGPTCRYVRDGRPSCIIGHAAARAGVALAVLEDWDSRPVGCDIATVLEDLYGLAGDACGWLDEVQRHQDYGGQWGAAVERADARLRGRVVR